MRFPDRSNVFVLVTNRQSLDANKYGMAHPNDLNDPNVTSTLGKV